LPNKNVLQKPEEMPHERPVAELTAAYEEEKRNRRPPVAADDIPFVTSVLTLQFARDGQGFSNCPVKPH
jgi:hypothetical protein